MVVSFHLSYILSAISLKFYPLPMFVIGELPSTLNSTNLRWGDQIRVVTGQWCALGLYFADCLVNQITRIYIIACARRSHHHLQHPPSNPRMPKQSSNGRKIRQIVQYASRQRTTDARSVNPPLVVQRSRMGNSQPAATGTVAETVVPVKAQLFPYEITHIIFSFLEPTSCATFWNRASTTDDPEELWAFLSGVFPYNVSNVCRFWKVIAISKPQMVGDAVRRDREPEHERV